MVRRKTEFEKLYAAGGKESLEAAVFETLRFDDVAVVKLAVEPLNPAELPKMTEGLRKISKSYPLARTRVEEAARSRARPSRRTPPRAARERRLGRVHDDAGELLAQVQEVRERELRPRRELPREEPLHGERARGARRVVEQRELHRCGAEAREVLAPVELDEGRHLHCRTLRAVCQRQSQKYPR